MITTTALGSIAINAFVLHGNEPVLVDTGTVAGAPEFIAEAARVRLQAGQVRWATVDSRWAHGVDRDALGHALDRLPAIEPTMVCSSHRSPAPGAMVDLFVESLAMAPATDPFVGPDHAALEATLAGIVDVPS